MSNTQSPAIGPYERRAAACHEYDPRAPETAGRIAELIVAALPSLIVEHVGSTSVSGCAGKGVVDLIVIYPHGELEAAKHALASLGFQRQLGRDPFPEERPMRTGSIEHRGSTFMIHAHVLEADSPEVAELRAFRDRLRTDRELVAAYVRRKREILASGVTDSTDYAIVKGEFVKRALVS